MCFVVGDEQLTTTLVYCGLLGLFFADVGFTVGKLFPMTYNCRSLDCAKIVHNCCMTLCTFPIICLEGIILLMMSTDGLDKPENQNIGDGPIIKVLEIVVAVVYVVYDNMTQQPPGVGTRALVVVTCLAEVVLILQEIHTVWKCWKGRKGGSVVAT